MNGEPSELSEHVLSERELSRYSGASVTVSQITNSFSRLRKKITCARFVLNFLPLKFGLETLNFGTLI